MSGLLTGMSLLEILTGGGATCRYHGDFDWAGLRIAKFVASRVSWEPWRYRSADYLEAIAAESPSITLADDWTGSPWDPELAAAMSAHGLAVEEEAVASLLATDLAGGE